MSTHGGPVARIIVCVLLAVSLAFASCRRGAEGPAPASAAPSGAQSSAATAPATGPATAARPAAPVVPKVLAEAIHQASALTIQVTDVQRVTPDTIRVEIALINKSSAPEPLDVIRALTGGQSTAFTPADLCLLTPDGSRRLFVLRDAENAPRTGGGFEPLQPGERRLVWALFPSPAPDASTVTVLVAGTALRDVPIAPAPASPGAASAPSARRSSPGELSEAGHRI